MISPEAGQIILYVSFVTSVFLQTRPTRPPGANTSFGCSSMYATSCCHDLVMTINIWPLIAHNKLLFLTFRWVKILMLNLLNQLCRWRFSCFTSFTQTKCGQCCLRKKMEVKAEKWLMIYLDIKKITSGKNSNQSKQLCLFGHPFFCMIRDQNS